MRIVGLDIAGLRNLKSQKIVPGAQGNSLFGANGAGINLFIELRQEARAKKDFATSDKIRQSLGAIGVTLEDRKGVTEWRIG